MGVSVAGAYCTTADIPWQCVSHALIGRESGSLSFLWTESMLLRQPEIHPNFQKSGEDTVHAVDDSDVGALPPRKGK